MDTTKICVRLQRAREICKLTQSDLAKLVGVSPTTISSYEIGYVKPNYDMLEKLGAALGVKPDYFIEDDDTIVEKYGQPTTTPTIAYFKRTNTNGILTHDIVIADGRIQLPFITENNKNIFCTDVDDNSMADAGIKKSGCIVVDCSHKLSNGDIAFVYCTKSKKFIIRRYITEGPMIMYVANGYGTNTTTIYSSKDDDDYKIIGKVISSIINM